MELGFNKLAAKKAEDDRLNEEGKKKVMLTQMASPTAYGGAFGGTVGATLANELGKNKILGGAAGGALGAGVGALTGLKRGKNRIKNLEHSAYHGRDGFLGMKDISREEISKLNDKNSKGQALAQAGLAGGIGALLGRRTGNLAANFTSSALRNGTIRGKMDDLRHRSTPKGNVVDIDPSDIIIE